MSMITTSRPSRVASATPRRATSTGSLASREDVDADLGAEHAQLLDRRGTLEVGRDEVGLAALLLEPQRELGRGRRLARALESGEQDRPSAGATRR